MVIHSRYRFAIAQNASVELAQHLVLGFSIGQRKLAPRETIEPMCDRATAERAWSFVSALIVGLPYIGCRSFGPVWLLLP